MLKNIRDATRFFPIGILLTNVVCVLFVLTVLSGGFGSDFVFTQQLLAVFLMLGVSLCNVPLLLMLRHLSKPSLGARVLLVGVFFWFFGFLILIVSKTNLLWISSIPMILSGIFLCLQGLGRQRSDLRFLTFSSFLYALVFLLLQTIPSLWSVYQQGSFMVSHAVGYLIGSPLALGPTTSGAGIFLLTSVTLLGCFFVIGRKTRRDVLWFCFWIGFLCILWFGYLLLLGLLSYPASDALNLHPVLFLLCLIPLFGSLLRTQDRILISGASFIQKHSLRPHLMNGAVWAAVFLFLSTFLFTLVLPSGSLPVEPQKIVFYGDHMVGTWDVPEYGKYGKDAVGMFGLWPVTLSTLGYSTEIVVQDRGKFLNTTQPLLQNITRYLNLTDYTAIQESSQVTTSLLQDASVFVVSNLNVSFTAQEQSIIWEYVRGGGSLLVIGDHTNVGGMQEPLNELLTPVGIRYRFDAALPLDEKFKWLSCTQLLHHPITMSLLNLDELQYGVGASLDLSISAFPIIIGSSVLSDEGNRSNADIAYLGDYEYNKGEQLGDVVLVAGAYYGDGRVLVFGDTSSFQNPALPSSYRFVQTCFSWLARGQTGVFFLIQTGVSLGFLLSAILMFVFFRKNSTSFIWFPAVLCISLILTVILNPPLVALPRNDMGSVVYIDASHTERFSLESFTDDSLNGFLLNLQRNNLHPRILREFNMETIQGSSMIVFNAPTTTFTSDEIRFLQTYMTQGGVVLLATGYEDKTASLPLLSSFGLDVEPTPLGPVPYVEENLSLYQNEPRFVDSWPITFNGNQTTSYYNFTWDDLTFHLVVFHPYGAGGLLLIGDSQFLLNKNLESIYDYWPGNILFIKYLIDELPLQENYS